MGSILHYAIQELVSSIVRYSMQGQQRGAQERRRKGGTRERGTGRKRPLGLLVAGGKAAGAWVIGGRGGRRHAMEERV